MEKAARQMDSYAQKKKPFLFVIDFEQRHPLVLPLDEINPRDILFSINGITNAPAVQLQNKSLCFEVQPVDKQRYCKAFDLVQKHIRRGDSFLLNLTLPSLVKTNYTLQEIFYRSNAAYKLWIKDRIVVFSPEIFVKIMDHTIRSFPMKGTMDASLPHARERLLQSKKELAEHYTIVDLIRNDLSIVAKKVSVKRFRYIDCIETHKKRLLQMSSEIEGEIRSEYQNRPGTLLRQLLPAGSISGAPKKKTIQIILDAEQYRRNWYTGVFGLFDGKNLDAGVMIRYLEKDGNHLIYKSGGGLTALSNCQEEYNELIDKIYVPFT